MTRQLGSFLVLLWFLSLPAYADEYWQQEVNYKMDVTLKSDLRTIEGTCRIQYINNSPDTLRELYLKAFPNAVQPGSYMDRKQREENDYSFAKLKPEEQGSLTIADVGYEKGGIIVVPSSLPDIDNTIIRLGVGEADINRAIDLSIKPHDTIYISLSFRTRLPSPHAARMGLFRGVSKAAYWYPQVCVYDRILQWNNSQYLGWGECYGDYGTFDVSITAQEDVMIAATGDLTNEADMLPDSLKARLQLANYLKSRSEWPTFSYDTSKTKTWHFLAKTVPDFAFVASRDYCIDEVKSGDTRVIAYALRSNAGRWKEAAEDGRKAIETFSQLYIPYQWPVMRICDAFGGMEFPMLVHVSGGPPSPGWYVVVWHEIAHNWFMGMIGSNQTDRPFLDEGFTTHAEHVIVEKYRGRFTNGDYKRSWYAKKFSPHDEDRDSRGYRPLLLMIEDRYDKPMVFSYDQGDEYFPYRVSAYYKTAAMHYNLRSILGDSAYFKAMQDYCRRWLFKHPYEEDFLLSMEQSTGLEMHQFLNQWYYSGRRLDYAFDGMQRTRNADTWDYTVKLRNRGSFVSPVDVAIIYDNGDSAYYTAAPEGMVWQKPGYTLLPTWNQFRRYDEKYQFHVASSRPIKKVVVDPQDLLMDINRLNNQSGWIPPTEVRFDNMKFDRIPVNAYALRWRPDVWYDEPNGLQLGAHVHGLYLEHQRRFRLDSRIGIESVRPMVDFEGKLPFGTWGPGPEFSQRLLLADYRTYSRTSYGKEYQKYWSRPDRSFFGIDADVVDVSGNQDTRLSPLPSKLFPYLPDDTWDAGTTYSATINSGFYATFRYGSVSMVSNNTIGGHSYDSGDRAFQESRTRLSCELTREGHSWLTASTEYITTGGEPPPQRVNHLSRASAVDVFTRSQVFRSPGTFPEDWADDFYLSAERVRGYQDRGLYFLRSVSGSIEVAPFGSLPLALVKKMPLVGGFLSKANLAVFADAATISMKKKAQQYRAPIANDETVAYDGKDLFASAGLSVTLPPVWSQQRIRLDFPLYLSKPVSGQDEFKFRFSVAWIIPSVY